MIKKFIAFLISYFLIFTLSAKTFLGVEELMSKSEAKKILYSAYNPLNVNEEGSDLIVVDPTFAGFTFSLATLYFTPIDGIPRFNGITLQRWFQPTQINEAKGFRDAIMGSIKKKYQEEIYAEFENDEGFKGCEFGTFKDGSLGIVEICRDKGKDGKERLYVFLVYFSFDRKAVEDEL